MGRLPERIESDGVVVRRWRVDDAERQQRAVAESLEHLRPWMPWAAHEPRPLAQRREMLAGWERTWEDGGDAQFAVVVDGRIAGSIGLHTRRGPGVFEIGYWIHPAFVRRGLATTVARMLTDAAFTDDGIERVEIRHDRANVASAGVPRRLGFTLVAEAPRTPEAPSDTGIDCVWSVTREEWLERARVEDVG
jgi:ribosomal-protein-serine acetyltransferase